MRYRRKTYREGSTTHFIPDTKEIVRPRGREGGNVLGGNLAWKDEKMIACSQYSRSE